MWTGAIVVALSVLGPLALLAMSGAHGWRGFPLDDAWIHMVYGRAVAHGGYLAYNEGVPAAGATAPLWAYVLGLIHAATSRTGTVVLFAKLTGILFHGLMAWAASRLLRRLTGSAVASFAAGLIAGLSPALMVASVSGMEVSLACALGLLAIERYLADDFRTAGILLGLGGLTRPEYGIVSVLLTLDLSWALCRGRRGLRDVLRFVVPLALAGIGFMTWNLYAGGRLLPATFYVKAKASAGFPLLARLHYGFKMIMAEPPLAGVLAWLGLFGLALSSVLRKSRAAVPLLAALVYTVAQVVLIPPTDPWSFYHIRYLLPTVPLYWVSLAAGTWALLAPAAASRPGLAGRPWAKALARGYAAVFLVGTALLALWGAAGWRSKFANDCRNIDELQVALGKGIDRAFPPQAVIGTVDAGAIKYFGKRRTVDLAGLNTPDIFRATPASLDAVVLMPAWTKLPPASCLETVGLRRTENYRVTFDPLMNTQVVMVCRSDSPATSVSLMVQDRTMTLSLKGCDAAQADALRQLLAEK